MIRSVIVLQAVEDFEMFRVAAHKEASCSYLSAMETWCAETLARATAGKSETIASASANSNRSKGENTELMAALPCEGHQNQRKKEGDKGGEEEILQSRARELLVWAAPDCKGHTNAPPLATTCKSQNRSNFQPLIFLSVQQAARYSHLEKKVQSVLRFWHEIVA